MSSDKDIDKYLKRLKKGEPCLEEFFNAYSGKIKFIATMYLIDKFYVSDVVMDTFCRILDSIQHYDETSNGMAWVCKIAQNEAYRINNRERKHTYVPLDDVVEEVACTNDFTESLGLMAEIEKVINTFKERDKKIVLMRLADGLTFTEIADSLGMYVGSVYKIYMRCIAQITEFIS